jgi:ADP-heptose:LPS heptosyltransferase
VTGKRFLISRLSAMGDTVCCLPAAVALKATFPDSYIAWLVDPRFKAVVECCPSVDEVVEYRPSLGPLPKWEPFDVAMDLQGLFKSAWPIFRARAKLKLAYHWQREGSALAAQRVLPDPSSLHVVDQYLDVARAAGADCETAEFNLQPPASVIESIREKLGGNGPLVILNPGAGWISKRWPPDNFAALADAVATRGVTAVLIGGKAEADVQAAEEVLSRCRQKPLNLVGQTNIKELIGLIGMAKAHVGGDTGSTHIAAALGVPAVGLYGITNPIRSCPYRQIDRCHYDPRGLAAIPTEPVIQTLAQILDAK